MPDEFEQGPSDSAVPGKLQSIEDLGPADFVLTPVGTAKPDWMETRFPVSMDEYRDLTAEANQPEPGALAVEDDPELIEDEAVGEAAGAAVAEQEVPEDGQRAAPAAALAPAADMSFRGTPQTAFRPPDCAMAVGASDVLLAVNVDLAGYRKDGSLRFRWPSMTALFSQVLPPGAGLFDPKLAYDHYARRWIVVVAARRGTPAGSWIMIAASQGEDAAGPYWVWALDASVDGSARSDNWADYPMLGFDTQAVYISTNQFRIGGGFSYAKLRILNKAELYNGAPLRWWDFWNLRNPDNSLSFTVQAAAHFRGLGGNPPAYLTNALWPSGSSLTLWQLSNPVGLWTGGAPQLARFAVPCRSYDLPPDAEQPHPSVRVETNDSRLLSAVYQYAGGVQRLWTTHTTKLSWQGESVARSGLQWYEIDVASRSVVQQGAFGAPGYYYYFPIVQTDIARNAYLCFSRSNSGEFGSLRFTGRRANDAQSALQGSALIKAGESAYTGGRWGDYFAHSRDGGDATRVWLYGEFADARDTWGTWAAAAHF
ncbi:hypothetical protein [Kribbella sp. NPDC049227]|jgi:hypothetical protein|uniref:hypothetical protein n=1 Tax=Kribbella sp. NPDC049227 TaxID=3364113 RepID=UPI0037201FD8